MLTRTDLKNLALKKGKLFPIPNDRTNRFQLPDEKCGFECEILKKKDLRCYCENDPRHVISLAIINSNSCILQPYGGKTAIMFINVMRFMYTIEAFGLRNTQDESSILEQALDFYIRTDFKHRNVDLPPNHQFSELLHLLKKSGYTEYIFDLATELNLNVDLILNTNTVARYKKIKFTSDDQPIKAAIGYLTVLINDGNWYVKTSYIPIATCT